MTSRILEGLTKDEADAAVAFGNMIFDNLPVRFDLAFADGTFAASVSPGWWVEVTVDKLLPDRWKNHEEVIERCKVALTGFMGGWHSRAKRDALAQNQEVIEKYRKQQGGW